MTADRWRSSVCFHSLSSALKRFVANRSANQQPNQNQKERAHDERRNELLGRAVAKGTHNQASSKTCRESLLAKGTDNLRALQVFAVPRFDIGKRCFVFNFHGTRAMPDFNIGHIRAV